MNLYDLRRGPSSANFWIILLLFFLKKKKKKKKDLSCMYQMPQKSYVQNLP